MNFHDLLKVETADTFIDLAFKNATKTADEMRKGVLKGNLLQKSKTIEVEKVKIIGSTLQKKLNQIIKVFPNFDDLPEFYKELIKVTVDYRKLKKSLGAVNWAEKSIKRISETYLGKIKMSREIKTINDHRKEFYGRASSIIKQINKELKFLEESRKIMKTYPNVKTSTPTVCICGFPNVGKSTLLSKISSAKPEIKDYAFTTKGLNLGYIKSPKNKIQLIDTPGTLNRFEKMNTIEQQAYLAVKHCADMIIYVYDLTETYDIGDQEKLFNKLLKFKKPVVIYFSKTDTFGESIAKEFAASKKMKKFYTSANQIKDCLLKSF